MDIAAMQALIAQIQKGIGDLSRLGPVIANDIKVAEFRRLTEGLTQKVESLKGKINRIAGAD